MRKEIVSLHKRDEEPDRLFKRTYEDMVSGRLSEARFDALSLEYDGESPSDPSEAFSYVFALEVQAPDAEP